MAPMACPTGAAWAIRGCTGWDQASSNASTSLGTYILALSPPWPSTPKDPYPKGKSSPRRSTLRCEPYQPPVRYQPMHRPPSFLPVPTSLGESSCASSPPPRPSCPLRLYPNLNSFPASVHTAVSCASSPPPWPCAKPMPHKRRRCRSVQSLPGCTGRLRWTAP